jgi:hypothetical protein
MKIAKISSYRHADAILKYEYAQERKELFTAIERAAWCHRDEPLIRKRNDKVVAVLSVSQTATNKALEVEFKKFDWKIRPQIISKTDSGLAADFRKSKIQVEVQFGNMARWYTDVFKFLLSYSADDIEVGVLVVPMQKTANRIDENVAYYERVMRELPAAKMGITIPILVLGVEDTDCDEGVPKNLQKH